MKENCAINDQINNTKIDWMPVNDWMSVYVSFVYIFPSHMISYELYLPTLNITCDVLNHLYHIVIATYLIHELSCCCNFYILISKCFAICVWSAYLLFNIVASVFVSFKSKMFYS
jgi:hypothetical protein